MADLRTLEVDVSYTGPYELIERLEDGRLRFESAQKAEDASSFNDLEINTVSWTVDPAGHLEGTAKFVSARTYDILKARLRGESPPPPEGQNYRDAFVDVIFEGGTRAFESAAGEAKVQAKLYDDGVSRGSLRGAVRY